MGSLLIKNARNMITMDAGRRRIPGGSLYAEGQEIVAIDSSIPQATADVVIDARDRIVFPGLINTHHHLFQTLTRNIPWAQDCRLFDWLATLYEIWRHMQPEDIYLGAMVGLGELLKTGCTTVADHFYCFPDGICGELIDEEIRAARELGVRFHPTRGSMSRGRSQGGLPPDEVCQSNDVILRDTRRVIETYHDPSRFSMLRVGVAPCSPFSVTADLLRESAVLARAYKVRLHTHLGETLDEEAYCREALGLRPLEFMEETGWVGPDVWFAHGIWFNDEEIVRMGRTGVGIAHCPVSNCKLSSGVFPIVKMLQAGVRVGLGVDGSASNDASNLLMEVKICNLIHKLHHGPTALTAEDCLALGTIGSAGVLGWAEAIGSLEVGKAADLFLVDVNQIGFAGGLFDDAALPVLTGSSQIVDTTIVGGKVVVQGGRLVNVDEERVLWQAQRAAERMLAVAAARTGVDYSRVRARTVAPPGTARDIFE